MKIKKLIIFLIILLNVKFTIAYIDPGTAGTIIGGSIWPIILAVFAAVGGFFIKYFYNPIKRGLSSLLRKRK